MILDASRLGLQAYAANGEKPQLNGNSIPVNDLGYPAKKV
jgi:hypothetical protein